MIDPKQLFGGVPSNYIQTTPKLQSLGQELTQRADAASIMQDGRDPLGSGLAAVTGAGMREQLAKAKRDSMAKDWDAFKAGRAFIPVGDRPAYKQASDEQLAEMQDMVTGASGGIKVISGDGLLGKLFGRNAPREVNPALVPKQRPGEMPTLGGAGGDKPPRAPVEVDDNAPLFRREINPENYPNEKKDIAWMDAYQDARAKKAKETEQEWARKRRAEATEQQRIADSTAEAGIELKDYVKKKK